MKRDRAMKAVLTAAGILGPIKPSPVTEQARRARGRVLEKLATKAVHFTMLSVLERTELRALEADGLIVCEGGGTWRLKSMPGPTPLPPGAGVIRCSPMPGAEVVGPGIPLEHKPRCSWCNLELPKVGPHQVCGTCLHRELLELGSEGAPV